MEVWVPTAYMQIVQIESTISDCFLLNKFSLDRLGQNAYPQNFVGGC
jgi:hypothetical protein